MAPSLYTSGTGVNPYVNKRVFCDAESVSTDLQKLFVQRLKEEMDAAQVSGNVLAKRAGIGQSTVSRVLNGKQEPTLGMIGQLADALQLPVWALFLDAAHIEQRVIRPAIAPAPQQKVVRLPTPYPRIFQASEPKPSKYRAAQRKKR